MFNNNTVTIHGVRLAKLEARVQALMNAVDGYALGAAYPEDALHVRGMSQELNALTEYLDVSYHGEPATKRKLTCVKNKKRKT